MKRRGLPVDLTAASALSVAGHLAIAFGFVVLVRFANFASDVIPPGSEEAAAPRTNEDVDVELEVVGEANDLVGATANPVTPPDTRPRGDSNARPDSGAKGKGGDDDVRAPALNLADRAEDVSLDRSILSRVDRSQLPRIRSNSKLRRTREDWRASRDPMEVTFFAIGPGKVTYERRVQAKTDPAHGAPAAPQRDSQGMELGMQITPIDDGFLARRRMGSATPGGHTSSPGVGTRASPNPLGPEASKANVSKVIPLVDRGTPSSYANDSGKPADDQDSDQEVQARLQSIVHASTAGGAAGKGKGGEHGAGAPGSGGTTGAGSTSSVLGSGGAGTPDPAERVMYLRDMYAKIQPLWGDAFPLSAALEGKQGTAIIAVVVGLDGSVTASVQRPSGVPEFDENVRQAVLRGAPYGPLPSVLQPSIQVNIAFTAKNPSVRPRDPGEGIDKD
ncbi:MAG: TonB family protein [Polyangiaceae bacterium]